MDLLMIFTSKNDYQKYLVFIHTAMINVNVNIYPKMGLSFKIECLFSN